MNCRQARGFEIAEKTPAVSWTRIADVSRGLGHGVGKSSRDATILPVSSADERSAASAATKSEALLGHRVTETQRKHEEQSPRNQPKGVAVNF